MKLIKRLPVLVGLLFFSLSKIVSAQEGTYGPLTYKIHENTITIIDCVDSTTGHVTIPSEILVSPDEEAYPVTSIAGGFLLWGGAFNGCNGITGVTIPSSVTSIGPYAFSFCNGLTEITIPSSVTSLTYAFAKCVNIEHFSVVGVNGVFRAQDGILYDSTFNTLVIYPPGKNQTIFEIPNTVTSVADGAFYCCPKIREVVIPNGLDSIGAASFRDCDNLVNMSIPDSVAFIGSSAFEDCDALTTVHLPSGIKNIPFRLFEGCQNLKTVNIPSDVTLIGRYSFASCPSLESISIPESVVEISSYAFQYSGKLGSVSFLGSAPTKVGTSAFRNTGIYVETGGKALVLSEHAASFGGLGSIWNGLRVVDHSQFINLPFLTWMVSNGKVTITDCDEDFVGSLEIPLFIDGNPVTAIGTKAFADCTRLTEVILPDSITSIGTEAFLGCVDLINLDLPESLTSIGSRAFKSCDSLTNITLPRNVSSLGTIPFMFCNALRSIQVDALNPNFQSLDGVLFEAGFNTLVCFPPGRQDSEYTIPPETTQIGRGAFYFCEGLSKVILPEGLLSIENWSFKGCSDLVEAVIPNSVTQIGTGAYHFCYALEHVVLPEGLTSIERELFSTCTNLSSIFIPKGITSIDNFAFRSCNELVSISFAGNAPSISFWSFDDVHPDAKIYVIPAATGFGEFLGGIPVVVGTSPLATSIRQRILTPRIPVTGQPVSIFSRWLGIDGQSITGVRYKVRKVGGIYGEEKDMRFVPHSGENPLFQNSSLLSFDEAGTYEFLFTADNAAWQGNLLVTVEEAQPIQASSLVGTFTNDGSLVVQTLLSGNSQRIPAEFSIIPADGDVTSSPLANSQRFHDLNSGEQFILTYPPSSLLSLDAAGSYKIRLTFRDENGANLAAYSPSFTLDAVTTRILSLIGPSNEVAPGSPQNFRVKIESSQSGAFLLEGFLTSGDAMTELSSFPRSIMLERGVNEINLPVTIPTAGRSLTKILVGMVDDEPVYEYHCVIPCDTEPLPIGSYGLSLRLWRDLNSNNQVDPATDDRVTAVSSFPNAFTMFGGNDPNDLDNNGTDDAWELEHGIVDVLGDRDGDGIPEWGEESFGIDPNKADNVPVEVKVVLVDGVRYAEFSYQRIKDKNDVYAFLIHASDDMVNWEDASLCFNQVNSVDVTVNIERVTFRCNIPVSVDSRSFFRAVAQRRFTEGPAVTLNTSQVLTRTQAIESSSVTPANGQTVSELFLQQVANLDWSQLGLNTPYSFFRHLESFNEVSNPKILNDDSTASIPAGHLVFFGDPNLSLDAEIEISQTLTAQELGYLREIRAHGIVGISRGDGTILIPNEFNEITEKNLVDVFDRFGINATRQLFLGSLSPVDAKFAELYTSGVLENSTRMSVLLSVERSHQNAGICGNLSNEPIPDSYEPVLWGDFEIPPANLNGAIAIRTSSGWISTPLSIFYNNGSNNDSLNHLGLWTWLADRRDLTTLWDQNNPFAVDVALCDGAFSTLYRLNMLPVEVVGADGLPLDELKVGKMEGAISENGVLNIDADIDRFYVRISGGKDFVNSKIYLETQGKSVNGIIDLSYSDNADSIDLQDSHNDIMTKSLLLVSNDVDDDYSDSSISDDDTTNDRTHLIQLGGRVVVSGFELNGAFYELNFEKPCNASRHVNVELVLVGLHDKEHPAEVENPNPAITESEAMGLTFKANEVFAQIGLEIDWTITYTSPPLYKENVFDLRDGLSLPPNQEMTHFEILNSNNDIQVFVVNELVGPDHPFKLTYGVAYPDDPVWNNTALISGDFLNGLAIRHTLAHEIGHLLTKEGHFGGEDPLILDYEQKQNLMAIGIARNVSESILGGRRLTLKQQEKIYANESLQHE